MMIQKVQDVLNQNKIKYITIEHSPACTEQELSDYKSMLGMELIEAVIVEIEHHQKAMVVIPASLAINLGSLQKALGTTQVRLIDRQEASQLFPGCEYGTIPPFGNIYQMETILAQDLLQNQEISCYLGSYRHLLRMEYREYEKLIKPRQEISFLTRSRYRALVSNVIPNTARKKLNQNEHCFLGVSLENKKFSMPRLIATVDWIANHYKRCTVFIADSIHQYTLQIHRGIGERRARTKALLLGREFIDKSSGIFERHADTCHIDTICASEIENSDEYYKNLKRIEDLVAQDSRFALSVKACADDFTLRHIERNADNFENFVELSRQYLIEELALTACLVKYGLSIMIYPGSLATIFGEIANAIYLEVPESLQQIIHVSLHLKKR